MTPEQRSSERAEIEDQIKDYLSKGGKIKQIPAGLQTSKIDGISFSERTRMEKKARLAELGLKDFSELPQRADSRTSKRSRSR